MKSVAFAGVALFLTIADAAADPAPTKAKEVPGNKMICVSETATGSRLATKKRCMTAAEWDRIQRLDRKTLHDVTRPGQGY